MLTNQTILNTIKLNELQVHVNWEISNIKLYLYLWLFVDTICQQGKGLDVKKLLRKENVNEIRAFR